MIEISMEISGNGFVLLDPETIEKYYGNLTKGTDLLHKYITTDEGNRIVEAGGILPITDLPSRIYDFIFLLKGEINPVEDDIWKENGIFPLRAESAIYLSDVGVLRSWDRDRFDSLEPLIRTKGFLAVKIANFVTRNHQMEVMRSGYVVTYEPVDALPIMTANLHEEMRF